MKQTWIILPLLCIGTVNAQKKDTVFATSSLSRATVYYGSGAELSHQTRMTLVKGPQHLVIDQVSLQPDIKTLQLTVPDHVTVLSYTHRIHSTTPPVPINPSEKRLTDSIRLFDRLIANMRNDISINEGYMARLTKLIEGNFTTPDKKNISSDELVKLTVFYTDKLRQIQKTVYEQQLRIDEWNQNIADIRDRLQRWYLEHQDKTQTRTSGQFIVQVMSEQAGPIPVELSYYTQQAGWTPCYDIRVKSIDQSFRLIYKAMVRQHTGLEWNGVKMSLSTRNPNLGTTLPVLTPYYLRWFIPQVYPVSVTSAVRNDADMMTLKTEVIRADHKLNYTQSLTQASAPDAEPQVQLRESQLNINYDIDLPYEIPSDGQSYLVNLKEEKLNVGFRHMAIPKLDQDAFLTAYLNRWDSLNLLPGQAGIIMDNVYLGNTYLDPGTGEDTLSLSLGRDNRIAVQRKMVREYEKTRRFKDLKTESFTYEITIRNNKKQAIELDLTDQIPVSQVKEVEVELLDQGKATLDPETGFLKWKVKLQPGESVKHRFQYQIKYPKGGVLQEVR